MRLQVLPDTYIGVSVVTWGRRSRKPLIITGGKCPWLAQAQVLKDLNSSIAANTRLAAIDIGSNSIRLLIAEAAADGTYRVLDDEKHTTRLAQDWPAPALSGGRRSAAVHWNPSAG